MGFDVQSRTCGPNDEGSILRLARPQSSILLKLVRLAQELGIEPIR